MGRARQEIVADIRLEVNVILRNLMEFYNRPSVARTRMVRFTTTVLNSFVYPLEKIP